MIFLSHNKKDKPIVEPIAIRLASIFGQDNVFYDSWSIQPGDGIIDKMNDGLEKVEFFFLFVSINSLSSSMVKLEWQNALMKATHGKCKIIPIRLDGSLIPQILMQTLYLDLYDNGLETILKQIVDIVEHKNTFQPQYSQCSNIESLIEAANDGFKVTIRVKYFMEPTSMFLICTKNKEEEINYKVESDSMFQGGFNRDILLSNGEQYNCIYIYVYRPITPQNPLIIYITPKNNANIQLSLVMKGENKHDFHQIPMMSI